MTSKIPYSRKEAKYTEEAVDDTQDYFDIPDDAKKLGNMTLVDVLKRFYKSELTDYAEELGFDIDEHLSEKDFREQYAKALIEHPVEVLRMLPLEDLMLLARLKKRSFQYNKWLLTDFIYEHVRTLPGV